MSSSKEKPFRDWLLKKYEGALKTIHIQHTELEDLRAVNAKLVAVYATQSRDRLNDRREDANANFELRARIAELSIEGRVTVTLTNLVEGQNVELDVGTISSSNGDTQIYVELPETIEVAQAGITDSDAPTGEPMFPSTNAQRPETVGCLEVLDNALDAIRASRPRDGVPEQCLPPSECSCGDPSCSLGRWR